MLFLLVLKQSRNAGLLLNSALLVKIYKETIMEYEIAYSLAKRVPDMERGFSISTSYGEIEIPAEYAKAFVDLTNKVLLKQRDSVQGKTA